MKLTKHDISNIRFDYKSEDLRTTFFSFEGFIKHQIREQLNSNITEDLKRHIIMSFRSTPTIEELHSSLRDHRRLIYNKKTKSYDHLRIETVTELVSFSDDLLLDMPLV